MQVTSTPSMTSIRLTGREDRAGDRAPGVEEVQPDRRRGAGHPVDARVTGVGDPPAGSLDGGVDARAGVDVEHAHRRRAVLRRVRAPARWRRGRRRRACCRSWGGCPPTAGRRRPGRTGSPRRSPAGRRATRWPPCWSACCPRRPRRAAAGRRRRWRRSGPRRARRSSSGSHSRRKNGPREVPARMSTQGTTLSSSRSSHTPPSSCIGPDSASGRPLRCRSRRSRRVSEPVEDAVDHHAGLAEVVGRVAAASPARRGRGAC